VRAPVTMKLRTLLATLLLAIPLLLAGPGVAPATAVHQYTGPGTVVTSFNLATGTITALDNGAVACHDPDGDGFYQSGNGGVCITFAQMNGGNAIRVDDFNLGAAVAFQACVDNNGDGICSGDGETGAYDPAVCNDRIYFSHYSFGWYSNPLWVDPAGAAAFQAACGGGGFPGYVVILCAGAHNDRFGSTPHVHDVTEGIVYPTTLPWNTGTGDYCGGLTAAKAYATVP